MELLGKPSEEFMDKISSDSVNGCFSFTRWLFLSMELESCFPYLRFYWKNHR
jgi:hypothetical protein